MANKSAKQRKPRNMFAFALIVQKRGKIQEDRRVRRSGEISDPLDGWEDDSEITEELDYN
jgi:hypothetical protein